jgi:hypothetical protein
MNLFPEARCDGRCYEGVAKSQGVAVRQVARTTRPVQLLPAGLSGAGTQESKTKILWSNGDDTITTLDTFRPASRPGPHATKSRTATHPPGKYVAACVAVSSGRARRLFSARHRAASIRLVLVIEPPHLLG